MDKINPEHLTIPEVKAVLTCTHSQKGVYLKGTPTIEKRFNRYRWNKYSNKMNALTHYVIAPHHQRTQLNSWNMVFMKHIFTIL